MSPEEQQSEMASFQDDNFLISSDVMQEVERLNNLPGGSKYSESFSLELEKLMKPHMDEFTEQMGKIMENVMGGLMGGMADAMVEVFNAASSESGTSIEEEVVFEEENPDTLFLLNPLYTSMSLSDLEANKNSLVENLEMELSSKLFDLNNFFLEGYDNYWEEDRRKISEIQRLCDRLTPVLEKGSLTPSPNHPLFLLVCKRTMMN